MYKLTITFIEDKFFVLQFLRDQLKLSFAEAQAQMRQLPVILESESKWEIAQWADRLTGNALFEMDSVLIEQERLAVEESAKKKAEITAAQNWFDGLSEENKKHVQILIRGSMPVA